MAASRKPDILADAAHLILTQPAKSFTGRFVIDEELLKAHGVTDFSKYAVTPGVEPLPDFFVD